jgi:hypothetical protein
VATPASEEKKDIFKEVVINDTKPAIRQHLTKRPVQDDIARRTHTVITTRGR